MCMIKLTRDEKSLVWEVKDQLKKRDNMTKNGEPQAFIPANKGRSIEVVLKGDASYWLYLRCSDAEYDSVEEEFRDTVGILEKIYCADEYKLSEALDQVVLDNEKL